MAKMHKRVNMHKVLRDTRKMLSESQSLRERSSARISDLLSTQPQPSETDHKFSLNSQGHILSSMGVEDFARRVLGPVFEAFRPSDRPA